MTWQQVFVVALVALPFVGCLAAALGPAAAATRIGVVTTGLVFAASLALLVDWLPSGPAGGGMYASIDHSWLAALDVRFHVGIDGISLPLVVLTGLLTFLCAIYTTTRLPNPGNPRAFVALLLLLEVGMVGTFVALDLVLFFVFFEIVLVPMYFLIGIWGGSENRGYAATKFILYTLFGSAFMLVAFLALFFTAPEHTFDMIALAHNGGSGLTERMQVAIFAALFVGFGIKTPMWPLHTWLPHAHTEAPTVGSVLLAGVLLKMGTYGFVRIALPSLPQGAHDFAPYLGALAAVGIVYGAFVCLAQKQLKRLIAYSSVGHMGFVLLGIATLTPVGINAALLGNIAHGLVTGLLFFVVGGMKDRYHTDFIDDIGGGALAKIPTTAGLLTFAAVASLGLPGLAGFWGEMLSLFAAYRPADGLSRPLFITFMVAGGVGTVLTAAYFLTMLMRVNLGVVPLRWRDVRIGDAALVDLVAWTPLVVLALAVGLYPRIVLGVTDAAVRLTLGGTP